MIETINRHEAINRITKEYHDSNGGRDRYAVGINVGLTKAMNILNDMPGLKPKTGKWIEWPECLKFKNAYSNDHIVCDCCGEVFSVIDNDTERFNYCPHCGAKMEEENHVQDTSQ